MKENASLGEDISDSKHKRGVEEVSSIEEYNVAISAPGEHSIYISFTTFQKPLMVSYLSHVANKYVD